MVATMERDIGQHKVKNVSASTNTAQAFVSSHIVFNKVHIWKHQNCISLITTSRYSYLKNYDMKPSQATFFTNLIQSKYWYSFFEYKHVLFYMMHFG